MLTPRENYLAAVHCEKPEWVPVFGEDANMVPPFAWDPDPATGRDWLGITWRQDDPAMAPMPDISRPAMTDIEQWRETVAWPDLGLIDWDDRVRAFTEDPSWSSDKATICMANTHGIFLAPVNMLGWVEALVAMVEEPEEYGAFVDRLTDFTIEFVELLGEHFHPDIIFSGDDFASGTGPFISRETFGSLFADNLRRIAETIHGTGALAEFHCCGNCQWLIDEMVACGYDIAQLPMPNEALHESMERHRGRLAMTGGWDRQGPASKPGAPEEVVRQSVHEAIDTWGTDGGLVFWDGGIIPNNDGDRLKLEWLMDELHSYGRTVYRH